MSDVHAFTWCGYEWMPQERWGILHPERPWTWYDSSCVRINDNGELELTTCLNPTTIIVDGQEYTPNYGAGLVSTTKNNTTFKYGHYIWVAKMPKGKHLWPALWMWSWDSWPPEIDVAEAWTSNCKGYYKFPWYWNVTTNIHDPNVKHNMAEKVCVCKMSDPSENFIKYELIWTPNELRFLYNWKNIRTINDPEIMEYLNKNTQRGMNIVMNVLPTDTFREGELKKPLIIKYFSYTPLVG